jgi:hypothetical protein
MPGTCSRSLSAAVLTSSFATVVPVVHPLRQVREMPRIGQGGDSARRRDRIGNPCVWTQLIEAGVRDRPTDEHQYRRRGRRVDRLAHEDRRAWRRLMHDDPPSGAGQHDRSS